MEPSLGYFPKDVIFHSEIYPVVAERLDSSSPWTRINQAAGYFAACFLDFTKDEFEKTFGDKGAEPF